MVSPDEVFDAELPDAAVVDGVVGAEVAGTDVGPASVPLPDELHPATNSAQTTARTTKLR